MRPLCVIPARRGSKRLPQKNVIDLAGKPMLAYSVEAARLSSLFDQVFVSTEDDEIGRIAEEFGAVYHRRPIELANDMVSATDVCIELFNTLVGAGDSYDAIVCLQPSSPLRSRDDIVGAWEKFCATGASYLVSVTPIDPHYFHWAVHADDGQWTMYFGDKYMMERTLLPPVFRPNGSIKIAQAESLRVRRNFFGSPLAVYETPEARSIHVAEKFDLDLARFLIKGLHY